MALMTDVEVPLAVLRVQIASAVDTIVQVSRVSDGLRYVTHVSEVLGYDPKSGYRIHHLFERPPDHGGGQ
jgi:pilus assembly protein CpaF